MRFLCAVFLAISLSFASFSITREEYELILKLRQRSTEQQPTQTNNVLSDNDQGPVQCQWTFPQPQVPQEQKEQTKTPDEIDLFIMSCFEAAREQMATKALALTQAEDLVPSDGHDEDSDANGQDGDNDTNGQNDDCDNGSSGASENDSSVATFVIVPFKTLKRKAQPVDELEETKPKKKLKVDLLKKRPGNKFRFVHRIPDSTVIYQHQYICPSRIAVFNLAKHVTHEDLFVEFRSFGFINRLWIATDQTEHHENMAFIEFSNEEMAYEAVQQMAGAIFGEQPIGVAMSPASFDRSSRKIKISASKITLALGSQHLRQHFNSQYLGHQYGFCVYAFQATVFGMTPFGFALFNDEEAAYQAKEDLHKKGFIIRDEIC